MVFSRTTTFSPRTLFVVAYVLDAPWEVLQNRYYRVAAPSSFQHVVVCLAMALVDATAIVAFRWIVEMLVPGADARAIAIAMFVIGTVTAIGAEALALHLSWWAYGPQMPTVVGIGLTPIAQLALFAPLSTYLAMRIARSRTTRESSDVSW